METRTTTAITIQTIIGAPILKVWEYWNNPERIKQWNQASPDWHCPKSENDLRAGGKFNHTMAAKDGSFSFDFSGDYTNVVENKLIESVLGDGRKIQVVFEDLGDKTQVTETFDAEGTNSIELQRTGWQTILNSFKKYTEEN